MNRDLIRATWRRRREPLRIATVESRDESLSRAGLLIVRWQIHEDKTKFRQA